jgi:hypothetical protein
MLTNGGFPPEWGMAATQHARLVECITAIRGVIAAALGLRA